MKGCKLVLSRYAYYYLYLVTWKATEFSTLCGRIIYTTYSHHSRKTLPLIRPQMKSLGGLIVYEELVVFWMLEEGSSRSEVRSEYICGIMPRRPSRTQHESSGSSLADPTKPRHGDR